MTEHTKGTAIVKDHDEWWGAVYECSICKEEWMLGSKKEANFCPYCGAVLSERSVDDG